MMSHETNTFSPVITDLARFSRGHAVPLEGQTAIDIFTDTASCLGGYLKVAAQNNADVFIPIAAGAPPSGRVEDNAYEYMCDRIVEGARDCDAMLLDLHGAMATRTYDDGEGELLKRIRAAAPDLPIAVSLDMHANLTEDMVANATIIAGYQTYPHVDMDTCAERAATVLFDYLAGRCKPVMSWANAPMLPHVMRQGTDDFPNRELQEQVAAFEHGGALAVSLFTGFPHADIHDAGLSVVVATNDDPEQAETIRDTLLDQAWEHRASFVYEIESLPESMERAEAIAAADGDGPVILLDHYDNTASGGTMDTTEVLAAILDRGLNDVAVFGFYDPEVVDAMEAAGVGNTVNVQLGGKLPMPALAIQSKPIELTGTVKLLSDGRFPATVAMSRGLTMNMGKTGILSLPGDIDIVVISSHTEPFDPGCFRSLGIEPLNRRYVMLKSRIHYRVGFRDIAKEVVECAGRGVCTSDYSEVTFENVRRPIYPLDGVNTPRSEW
jgi:microcystin degradation protein MlrC